LPFVAVLDSTVVHESVCGQGLQRSLHESREQCAKVNGCDNLYSTVHPENHASVNNRSYWCFHAQCMERKSDTVMQNDS